MRLRGYFVSVLLLLPVGCGKSNYAPVSGRITVNGQPLANAAVLFSPVPAQGSSSAGLGSGATTDSDGRYTLLITGTTTKGAVIGKHKVQVTLIDDRDSADDSPHKFKQLPPKYSGKNTVLEYDVPPGGSTSADFDLSAK
jgi:hypothetical protein